jgi:tetratricopeptide (TPR) repeat protein
LIAAAIPYITLVGAFQTPTDTSMRAFDAQRKEDFREAAALYETEAASAPRTPALFYNLGSSHYLSGRLGHAVLNYARAYRLAPGNEGFKTNLARLSAIAGVPDLLVYRFDAWDRLQPDGWTLLAAASYWLLVLIAVARRLSPGVPIPATLLSAVLVAGGAFSAYGAWTWEAPANRNQAIVMTESKGRFGPMRSARVQFPLREGSAVELLESHADWIKIEVNGDRGWIERSAVERVVR